MYNGRRANPAAQESAVGHHYRSDDDDDRVDDEYEDDYYEDVGEDVQHQQRQPQPQRAGQQPNFAQQEAIEADAGRGQHIGKRFVTKATCVTKFLDVDFVGTAIQFAKGLASTDFRIADHLQDELKFIDTDVDRHQATAEQRKGNVRRICILSMPVVEHGSTAPYAVDLVSDKYLMRSTIATHDSALHRVQAHTPVAAVKFNVFSPTSYMDEYTYKNGIVCNRELVESWVREPTGKDKNWHVEVGSEQEPSLAYQTLVHNMFHEDPKKRAWVKEPLSEKQREAIRAPTGQTVEVTPNIGRMIKARLLKDVADFEARCIDLNEFVISARRSDGISDWASPDNLIGEILDAEHLIGDDAAATLSTENHEVPTALKTRFNVHTKFKARLILF